MRVEVINTGTELLLGSTVNTHLAFIANELFPLGLRIQRQVAVPDGNAIRDALVESFGRAEIVFVTGGLGPTTDDLTREITAELLGCELVHDPEVMRAIEARFEWRGLKITERVKRQAMVPRGATVLPNANGTAPGLCFGSENFESIRHSSFVIRHLFLLPGPPRELSPMFLKQVMPMLRELVPSEGNVECRTYRILGLGESTIEALVGEELLAIDGLELGYCARSGGEVEIRCIGTPEAVGRAEAVVLAQLGKNLVPLDDRAVEQVVVDCLTKRKETLAIAESCTGGFLAHAITNVAGASAVFTEGFVTYANEAKIRALGIDPAIIAAHGAVSHQVAAAMAEGARAFSSADYALSTTGIAGPGGGTEEKPVGTVFIALASKSGATRVEQHNFPTNRRAFKSLVAMSAFDLLRKHIS